MNIKIVDSWLREFVKTEATPKEIAEKLSLTSVSVERITQVQNDFVYDIEVTTNRPELMSVISLARELATILPQFDIPATFIPPEEQLPNEEFKQERKIEIISNPKLIQGLYAIILQVKIAQSPALIKNRIEESGIRSLNNVIDITNYIMRETGHPTHVFDYDRLQTKKLIIRESEKGEKITTLDGKEYELMGGDIVADDGTGQIVDLLGIMGTKNSVVTPQTKNILYFIDTVEPHHIRKTSMHLGIRTEAAVLNEKGINPHLAKLAFARGVRMFEKIAQGVAISKPITLSHSKEQQRRISLPIIQVQKVIGVPISVSQAENILTSLGFITKATSDVLEVTIPPEKMSDDMTITEDLIEEIARVYGYHKIPNTLPTVLSPTPYSIDSSTFYWEDLVKDAMRFWGYTEVYTYPMVSEELYEGPTSGAVTIKNPLGTDMVYMRNTLVPSLLDVVRKNKNKKTIKIFEIANIYLENPGNLPEEKLRFAGIIHKTQVSFFEVKGLIEQLCNALGVDNLIFTPLAKGGLGATLHINKDIVGEIELLDDNTVDFELDFALLLKYATRNKSYKKLSKYPAITEDLAIIAPQDVSTGDLIQLIKEQNILISEVTLLDKFENTRTFHIVYQSFDNNLTDEQVSAIRVKILKKLADKYSARLKV